jgi:hypothetical protein
LSYFAAASQIPAISRAIQGVAVAGALKDAIPNPGDRFALRVDMAEAEAAGWFGFSYNLSEGIRLSVNYGQGRSQSIVSAGMNFAVH